MLILLFSAGPDRYGIPAGDLIEVLPLVALEAVPQAPAAVAGLLDYHGTAVPVIDLNRLLAGTPCRQSLTSRILLVNYRLAEARGEPLGLMAEWVTETVKIAPEALRPTEGAGCLGKIAIRGAEPVRVIRAEALLKPELETFLYPPGEESP